MELLIYIIGCLVILAFSTWVVLRDQDLDGREFTLIVFLSFVPILNLLWLASWIWYMAAPILDKKVFKKRKK